MNLQPTFKAVCFLAVSSEKQTESESLKAQLADCRAAIAAHPNWQEVHLPLTVDGHSRSLISLEQAREEMPAFERLLELVRGGQVNLVVTREDNRLWRTVALGETLHAILAGSGAQIYSCLDRLEPKAPEQAHEFDFPRTVTRLVRLALSQGETSRLKYFRAHGMRQRVQGGLDACPRPPYGYARVPGQKALQVHESQARVVQSVETWFMDEGLSMPAIARRLMEKSIPAARGMRWYPSMISDLLTNPFYAGQVRFGVQQTDIRLDADGRKTRRMVKGTNPLVAVGQHTPLRTPERQAEIEARLKDLAGKRRGRMGGKYAIWPFAGIVVCVVCNRRLRGESWMRGKHRVHACPDYRHGLSRCQTVIYERDLLKALAGELARLARTPGALEIAARCTDDGAIAACQTQKSAIRERLEQLPKAAERWDRLYEAGGIDVDRWIAENKRLATLRTVCEQEGAAIDRQLARLMDSTHKLTRLKYLAEHAERLLLCEIVDRLSLKLWIQETVERIEVSGKGEIERIIFA